MPTVTRTAKLARTAAALLLVLAAMLLCNGVIDGIALLVPSWRWVGLGPWALVALVVAAGWFGLLGRGVARGQVWARWLGLATVVLVGIAVGWVITDSIARLQGILQGQPLVESGSSVEGTPLDLLPLAFLASPAAVLQLGSQPGALDFMPGLQVFFRILFAARLGGVALVVSLAAGAAGWWALLRWTRRRLHHSGHRAPAVIGAAGLIGLPLLVAAAVVLVRAAVTIPERDPLRDALVAGNGFSPGLLMLLLAAFGAVVVSAILLVILVTLVTLLVPSSWRRPNGSPAGDGGDANLLTEPT